MKKLILIMIFFATGKIMNAQISHSIIPQKDTVPVSQSSVKDYVSMQGGQMILIQNNKVSRLKKNMTMKNGTVVKTNGTVKTNDGKTFQLHEGDRVYMNGLIEGPEKSPI